MEKRSIADLATISYSRLLRGDPDEVAKLLEVCTDKGFFYLDMKTGVSLDVIERVQRVYSFMETWFNQPHETKMKDLQSDYRDGYKPVGVFAGVYDKTRDCYETLKISNGAVENGSFPQSVSGDEQLFRDYIKDSTGVAIQLLSSLSDSLGLRGDARFEKAHATPASSNSTLVLLKYPKGGNTTNVGHNKHTDIGSITYLYTREWGLQVLDGDGDDWQFIEPRAGCAVINVGDSLRFLSQKRLKSCIHRVVPDGPTERYTIAHFLRPDNDVTFVDADGKSVFATQWHDRKYAVFKEAHEEQRKTSVLTGGREPFKQATPVGV